MKTHLAIKIIIFTVISLALMSFSEMSNEVSHNSIRVIFLIDDSGSMANSDPDDLRFSAARLFVSLLDQGDFVGAVLFSDQASEITSGIEVIDSMDAKLRLADVFQSTTPSGYTDIKAAFSLAGELLKRDQSNPGRTIIILLTDGQPEPLNYYSGYESDTIELAKSLDIPVISIALTEGASINFLTRLSAQTTGDVYPADTALDLLDVYLQILGQWKHRTIVGEGLTDCPFDEIIKIDQELLPYINHVSFAISKEDNVQMTLINPEGTIVDQNNPLVDFYQLTDPEFSIISLDSIMAGDWQVTLEGSGIAQIRVIIDSNLRIGLSNLESFTEAGQPLLLEAEIIEIDESGMSKRVVGEGRFTAVVTLPDGTEESLDQFYDDGTHGDITANDGLYSRIYANTKIAGPYSIRLFGYKGVIPLQTEKKTTIIAFPEISIASPQSIRYTLEESEQIPLEINIKTVEGEALDSGSVKVRIMDEKGTTSVIELIKVDSVYSGSFKPSRGGHYQMEVFVEDGLYQSLPYSHEETTEFDVYLRPHLAFELVNEEGYLLRAQNEDLVEGLQMQVKMTSTADDAILVSVDIEGNPDIYIDQFDQVTIPPNGSIIVDLLLRAKSELSLGEKPFQIVFSSDTDVTLVGSVIPVSVLVYRPAIRVENVEPVACNEPMGCYWWKSEIVLTINSTSKEEITITLELSGDDPVSMEESEISVSPGEQDISVFLLNDGFVPKGLREYSLSLSTGSDNVTIEPNSTMIDVQLVLPSFATRCKKWIFLFGIGSGVIVAIIRILAKSRRRKVRETWITGTFQYWDESTPHEKISVDLTELKKKELLIGSDPDCAICISGEGIDQHHIRIFTMKVNDQIEVAIEPIGEVHQGYTQVLSELTLENETTFTLGKTHCRYLSDSGY